MKEIYFVRHGETDNNKLGKAQGGSVDSELNKTGIEQATYTGTYFKDYRIKDKNFDMVYCSPLKRAKKTAEIICTKIGYDEDKIVYDDNLRDFLSDSSCTIVANSCSIFSKSFTNACV